MSTLYRTLRQMEKDGYLESTWEPGPTGPARRIYSLTDAGRTWLDASAMMLTAYRDTIDRFFGLYGTRPHTDGPGSQPSTDPQAGATGDKQEETK
jgi:PadR family transcriptional regulator PadR